MRLVVHRMLVAVAAASIAMVGLAAPAQAADPGIAVVGRGWGHGRGMGQYGALGYAVNHGWSAQQILNHFYRPATLATNAGNPAITVELTALTNREVVITAPSLRLNGGTTGNTTVRIVRNGAGLDWYAGPGCGGPWTPMGTIAPDGQGRATASVTPWEGTTDVTRMLRVCGAGGGGTIYRGSLDVVATGGQTFTINSLPMQDYLRGVVPREMPASWASQGGGRGAQALAAQAVAARSYALALTRRPSGAQSCDTTACQVYGGAMSVTAGGAVTSLEHPLSDQAVAATQGWVMRMPGGAVALTEFSSSTGGYTAGGRFTAVVDDGDAITSNPNRSWATWFTAADVANRLGVGTISSIEVTGRNGLGQDGGRVTQVTVTSSSGTRTFTGAQLRTALDLRSDWFSIVGTATSNAGTSPTVVGAGHAAGIGWLPWLDQGKTLGTTGQARALEAVALSYIGSPGNAIECRAHVAGVGWQSWTANGLTCGTTGQARQLEAVQLRLTGPDAAVRTVWTRAHVATLGWQPWVPANQTAGTTGRGLPIEALQVMVLPAGAPAPGAASPIEYRSHAADLGWMAWVRDGALSGTTGQARRLEAVNVRFPAAQPWAGGIECSAHVATIGWGSWVGAGADCGTTGRALQLEAIKLRLTGDVAANMDVWYRVHSADVGWSGWARNGEAAGTQGRGLRAEAIEVRYLPRGSAAPGSTANALRIG